MMPYISVIVPVYNTEQYLNDCIESIQKQSFINYELILIDDGSSDSSGLICDSYEKTDNRIRVFHTDNKGVSCARNLGLYNARGTYVMFVDSDDILPDNAISGLISDSEDFTVGGLLRIAGRQKQAFKPSVGKHYHNDKEGLFYDDTFPISELLDGPCAKLFRTDIIRNHNLKFNEKLNYGEDKLFVYSYLLNSKTMKTTSDIVYIQKRRDGSLSSDISSQTHLKKIIDFLTFYVNVVKAYQDSFLCSSVKKMYHHDVICRYVYRYLRIVRNTKAKSISRIDMRYISALLKDDDGRVRPSDGRYIKSCVLIARYMPSCFFYLFIKLVNAL